MESHIICHDVYGVGGVNNMEKVRGIQVYPKCAEGGGILATGSVSDVLQNTNTYDADTRYAVRLALANGSLGNWEILGGFTVHNGETWPGMSAECTYLDFIFSDKMCVHNVHILCLCPTQ